VVITLRLPVANAVMARPVHQPRGMMESVSIAQLASVIGGEQCTLAEATAAAGKFVTGKVLSKAEFDCFSSTAFAQSLAGNLEIK